MSHDPRSEGLLYYPYVIVRLACGRCGRRGSYRLTRLVEKFGTELDLESILGRLARDCVYRVDQRRGLLPDEFCEAYFPDLEPPCEPPDFPPAMMTRKLRVVRGGKT